MKTKIAIAALTAGATVAVGSLGVFGTVKAQEPTKSVRDGVYSVAQAKRGDALYAEQCASCHGPDLAGGEMAPAVVGADFYANWVDLTLGDLSERIRVSMPQNNPQSLSRAQTADILAFLLYRNNFPAGEQDLFSQTEYLNTIKIEPAVVGADGAAAPAAQQSAPADPSATPAATPPATQAATPPNPQ
jgi:mono/diheme cytochrome c family protein